MTKDSVGSSVHSCGECIYCKSVDWMLISLCCNRKQEDRLKVEPDYEACDLFERRDDGDR